MKTDPSLDPRKPIMIWSPDGCWFQEMVGGVIRSSYLGQIGTTHEVHSDCLRRGIQYTEFHSHRAMQTWVERRLRGA